MNNIMKQSFPSIVDVNFTANMGAFWMALRKEKSDGRQLSRIFIQIWRQQWKKAETELEQVKIEDEVTDVICEECGRNMVVKYGPHGKFLACPGLP